MSGFTAFASCRISLAFDRTPLPSSRTSLSSGRTVLASDLSFVSLYGTSPPSVTVPDAKGRRQDAQVMRSGVVPMLPDAQGLWQIVREVMPGRW
ncbi:MAG: hypothetical protein WCS99_06170 [Limisphaerales bacterium]